MKVCTVEGCGGTFRVMKGLCNKHYLRLRRHGDPLAGGTERGAVQEFFDAALNSDTDECIIWPFARDANGYAKIRRYGENRTAHRLICQKAHGSAPGIERHATHTCGNGNLGCINPKHLEWGTPYKNQQDRVGHGTSNRGERCAAHKLKTEEVLVIFARIKNGERLDHLAAEYGVSGVTISDIKLGRSWAWLTGLQNPRERDRYGNLVAANDNQPQRRAA